MIAVETNILVYAHRREVAEHAQAADAVRELAEGEAPWAIPWPCVFEFFSVVTNPRIWKDAASSPAAAWRQINAWRASPSLVLLHEIDGAAEVLDTLVKNPRVRGPIIHDARIAALCIAHGVEALLTRDRDFALFPLLKTRNPLG